MAATARCVDDDAPAPPLVEPDEASAFDPRAADEFRRWFNRRWPSRRLPDPRGGSACAPE